MNKLFKTLSLLAAIAFLGVACVPPLVDVAQAAPAGANYESTLGKSVSDESVADFIASNSCTAAAQFQLCPSAGLALWTDNSQIVKTAYLYVNASNNMPAYQGRLPLGLAASDTMEVVQQKLGQPVEVHAPQAGWRPGLPDEGGSPDHLHFWAIYRRFGMTVIYNTPSLDDKNATIYAILVSK